MTDQKSLLICLSDAESTKQLGKLLGESLFANTVILLDGELGTGKTTLIQGVGQGLGIQDLIVSPTFTLIQEYLEGRFPLYHFDLYRLSTAEIKGIYPELYWEGIEVVPGITAIEWAEKLPYKPSDYLSIYLTHTLTDTRQAEISVVGKLPNFDLTSLIKSLS